MNCVTGLTEVNCMKVSYLGRKEEEEEEKKIINHNNAIYTS